MRGGELIGCEFFFPLSNIYLISTLSLTVSLLPYPRDLQEAIERVKLHHWGYMEVCKSLQQHRIDHNYNML